MKMRWGWYMVWASDPMETKWLGTCPVYVESMRKAARKSGRRLIESRVKIMGSKRYFCAECQVEHN